MKLDDYDEVKKLVTIREKCMTALEQLVFFEQAAQGEDCGGVEGFDTGFFAAISQHRDGSGTPVDLAECYVGVELAAATREVLENQIERVNARLQELGVTL